MANGVIEELILQVRLDGGTADDLDRATSQIRSELRDAPVESIVSARAQPPPGSKAGEIAVAGALVLQLAPKVLPVIVDLLKSWTRRKDGRRVVVKKKVGDRMIELEVHGSVPPGDVEAFLRAASTVKI